MGDRARLWVGLVWLVGGCAATSYKPAIDSFATATGKAGTSYAALEATVLAAQTERLSRMALEGAQVRPVAGDCVEGAAHCRLEVRPRGGKAQVLEPKLGHLRALLDGVGQYAGNLQAIVNATTAADVSASIAAVGGSVKSLADLAGQRAAEVSAIAQPAANLAAFVAGEVVNQAQIAALRDGTRVADPVIQATAKLMAGAARTAGDEIEPDLLEAVTAALDAYRAAPTDRGKLDDARRAAAAYETARAALVEDVFGDMARAHAALRDHLAGKDVSLADAAAALQTFGTKAQQLADLVDALKKAQAAGKT